MAKERKATRDLGMCTKLNLILQQHENSGNQEKATKIAKICGTTL